MTNRLQVNIMSRMYSFILELPVIPRNKVMFSFHNLTYFI